MSADLLAAFGTGANTTDSSGNNAGNPNSQPAPGNSFDDEEFDSFVSPGPTSATQQDFDETSASMSRTTQGPVQNFGYPAISNDDPWLPSEPGGEVLFDASLEETLADDASWGEFETAHSTSNNQLLDLDDDKQTPVTSNATASQIATSAMTSLDLLSLEDRPPSKESAVPKVNTRKKPSQATPQAKVGRTSLAAHPATPQAPLEDDFFGEWDDFKDGRGEEKPQTKATPTPAYEPNQRSPNTLNQSKRSSISDATIRPTNIPPPSVILQIFPLVLENLREQVNQSKRRSAAPGQDLVSSLVSTLRTASHVIAGRSQRWKRDTRLSQSMRIGPAGFGKSSGMKLSSVSKGENIKEEQEVVTVIESWRNHTASFNSFIQSSGQRPIPVIADKSRVDTARPEDGALKASHACALCGLKRDERLAKVDEDIQDSFGDWWTEHWGHTDCRRFWEENSKYLTQR